MGDGQGASAVAASSGEINAEDAFAIEQALAEDVAEPPLLVGPLGTHLAVDRSLSYGRNLALPALRLTISLTSTPAGSPELSHQSNALLAKYAREPALAAERLELGLTRTVEPAEVGGDMHQYYLELRERTGPGGSGKKAAAAAGVVLGRALICVDAGRNQILPYTSRYNLNLLSDPTEVRDGVPTRKHSVGPISNLRLRIPRSVHHSY